jgi:hypothetical protein
VSKADDFANDLAREMREHVDKNMDLMSRKMTIQALNGCSYLSPVRKGRLKGNWQVNTHGGFVPMERFDPDEGSDASMAQISEAESALNSRTDPFATIFVGNGLDYASHVNDGTPRMPARPMVEPTVESINRQFARVKAV